MIGHIVSKNLEKWKNNLLDKTRNNRLINYRLNRSSSLKFTEPMPEEIVDRLMNEKSWSIYLPPELDLPENHTPEEYEKWKKKWPKRKKTEVKIHHEERKKCRSSVRNLNRKDRSSTLNLGYSSLYLASGFLKWYPPELHKKEWRKSPLFISEAYIHIPKGDARPEIGLNQGFWTLNPTIKRILQSDYNVNLAKVKDEVEFPNKEFDRILKAVKLVIPGAEILDELVMDIFHTKKETIFRDLDENQKAVIDHPFVKALCHDGSKKSAGSVGFTEAKIESLDKTNPPEKMHNVLDADSSQLQAIVACRDGHSFVMDGPPGTGKSQSIANMISELLANGKKILFVSEKAAALEVVQNRLEGANLKDYTLALHDEKATRKNFVEELHKSLTTHPKPHVGSSQVKKLKDKRASLSEHALWMNTHHEEMGSSLIDVIGRTISNSDLKELPPFKGRHTKVNKKTIERAMEAAENIVDEWDIFLSVESNPWASRTKRRIEKEDHFELKEAIDDFLSRSLELKDAESRIKEMFRLAEGESVANPEEMNKFPVLIKRLKSANIPANYLIPENFYEIKSSFLNLVKLQESARGYEDNLPVMIHHSQYTREPSDIGKQMSDIQGVIGTELIDHRTDIDIDAFTKIPENLSRSLETLAVLGASLEQLNSNLPRGGLNSFNFNTIRALCVVYSNLCSNNLPELEWLERSSDVSIPEIAKECTKILEKHQKSRDALGAKFHGDQIPDSHGEDCETITSAGFTQRFSKAYRDAKRRIKGARKDGRMPRKEELQEIIDFASADSFLDKMLVEGKYSIITGGMGLDHVDSDFMAGRLELYESTSFLISKGLRRSDCRVFADGKSNPVYFDVIDSMEKINDNFKDLKQDLQEYPINWEHNFEIDDISARIKTTLDCFRNSEDATNELLRASRSPINKNPLQEITLDELRLTLELLVKLNENQTRISKIHDGLENQKLNIAPLYSVEMRDLSQSEEHLAGIEDLLSKQKNGFNEDSLKQLFDGDELKSISSTLESAIDGFKRSKSIFRRHFDIDGFLHHNGAPNYVIDDCIDFSKRLKENFDDVEAINRIDVALEEIQKIGLAPLLAEFKKGDIEKTRLGDAFSRAMLTVWIEAKLKSRKVDFNPNEHQRIQEEFKRIDRDLISHKQSDIIRICNNNRPNSDIGFASTIKREKEKKRRHKPIRSLFIEGMTFIQSLKPCMMMSPLTVSHFLPPRAELFDVVIFDEASQIRPEEAINCIYRSKQVIIAGDQKQLPPTSFFSTVDEDEEYEEGVDDYESLLDLAKQGDGVKSLSLKWHYRSQHEDLITYSNRSFYSNELFTFPSSISHHPLYGVSYTKVDGTYARGTTRDNEVEAYEVYRRIEEILRHDPNLTIGVVTFNKNQQAKIESVIDIERRNNPMLDEWFSANESRLDGFFVKNIETVQGDERDVILFSTAFGPDSNGKQTENYGALNKVNGWRRLNVAVTRARKRLEIITSIDTAKIKANTESIRHFKRFLEYAQHGPEVFDIDLVDSMGDPDSPFEEEVIKTIQKWGYDVVPQVGCASYRIDIGVKHPDHEGHYCLAIECDGAMYHSSPVARDRDRLRESVLRNLGWDFHRIWGTAWYRERARAEESLKSALESAASRPPLAITKKKQEISETTLEVVQVEFGNPWEDVPYEMATFKMRNHKASKRLHGIPLDGVYGHHSNSTIERQIKSTIKIEFPIHEDLLFERIKHHWNMKNATLKFKVHIGWLAGRSGVFRDRKGFYWPTKNSKVTRYRNTGLLRSPKHVSDEEVSLVFDAIFERSHRTLDKSELFTLTAKVFSWGKKTSVVTNRLEAALKKWGEKDALRK